MSDALLTRIAEALEKLVHYHVASTEPRPPQPEDPPSSATEPQPPQPKYPPASATETVKRGRPPKAPAGAAAEPAASPAPAAPTAPASVAAVAVPAAAPAELVTQTANAVIDLANNYSRDAALACMAKYGAQKVSQVKPGDLAGLLADVTAAIAGEKVKKASESLV